MAASCKINNDEEAHFETNAAGVSTYNYLGSYISRFQNRHQLQLGVLEDLFEELAQLLHHQGYVRQDKSVTGRGREVRGTRYIKKGLQEQYFKLYKMKNRKKNRRLAVEI